MTRHIDELYMAAVDLWAKFFHRSPSEVVAWLYLSGLDPYRAQISDFPVYWVEHAYEKGGEHVAQRLEAERQHTERTGGLA